MRDIRPLIRFRCDNPAHQRPKASVSDTMTIHERSWAYCPYDVRETGHLWAVANPDAPFLLAREPADLPARG
jgi:hypothetical protein